MVDGFFPRAQDEPNHLAAFDVCMARAICERVAGGIVLNQGSVHVRSIG